MTWFRCSCGQTKNFFYAASLWLSCPHTATPRFESNCFIELWHAIAWVLINVYLHLCLCEGDIPDLFSDEEVDMIVASIRLELRGLGLLDTRENCWNFFIDRIRRQLKVISTLKITHSPCRFSHKWLIIEGFPVYIIIANQWYILEKYDWLVANWL